MASLIVESTKIVYPVRVNRSQSPRQVLEATLRRQFVSEVSLNCMPRCEQEEVTVIFFKPDLRGFGENPIMSEVIARELDLRGFMADPYAQAAVNQEDSCFAGKHPNCASWQDDQDKWHDLVFYEKNGRPSVRCNNLRDRFGDDWWIAAVPKS